jgi:hypothetical protein
MAISDYKRALQVDAVFYRSPMEHPRTWLATDASVGGSVWTIIDSIDISADVAQPNGHQIVHVVHEGFRVVSASDSRLIGDDKDEKPALI